MDRRGRGGGRIAQEVDRRGRGGGQKRQRWWIGEAEEVDRRGREKVDRRG